MPDRLSDSRLDRNGRELREGDEVRHVRSDEPGRVTGFSGARVEVLWCNGVAERPDGHDLIRGAR